MPNNINPVSSVGLKGLPHFRSSRVSTGMYEPVYQNLFTVEIQLPDALREAVGQTDMDLFLEGVTKVSGLDTNKVPGADASQTYKFATRRFANAGPESTTIDVTLAIEINLRGSAEGQPDIYQLKTLRRWNDLIYDPLTGRMGLKADYVAPQVVITAHDKAMQPFWQWTLYHVWPKTSLPAPDFNYTEKSSLYKVDNYTLACDYWDEVML